jgi:hypothetical protein
MTESERRERDAQRDAVAHAIPDAGDISVLRAATGEVIVYEDLGAKRQPTTPRAIVLPDGETLEFEQDRFKRK